MFAYNYDRDSANYSRDDLEKLLRYLQNDPQIKTISILAHSMGNWVTLEALRQMAIRDRRVAPKVKVVMLADADVDVDIAREQIATLGPERPHIVLFVNENDLALAASRDIWEAPRLGAIDPNVQPYKSMIEQDQLSVINMTRFPSHDFFNHGKYAEDPRVVELIGSAASRPGRVLTDRRVGLGARIMLATSRRCGFGRARRRPCDLRARLRGRSGDAQSFRRPDRPVQPIRSPHRIRPCRLRKPSRGKRVASSWVLDWSWGLPLLVFTIVAHVSAIVVTAKMLGKYRASEPRKASRFIIFVALAALASTLYLALEAAAWAALYVWVGALSTWRAAVVSSVSAITSYGHADVYLEDRWRLLGAIEAVNGVILFGLTTAFLYAAIHQVWPLRRD